MLEIFQGRVAGAGQTPRTHPVDSLRDLFLLVTRSAPLVAPLSSSKIRRLVCRRVLRVEKIHRNPAVLRNSIQRRTASSPCRAQSHILTAMSILP